MRLAKKAVDSNLLRHLQSDQSGYFKHARNAHFPAVISVAARLCPDKRSYFNVRLRGKLQKLER